MWRSLRHRVKGLSLKDKVVTAHVVFIDSISIRPPLTSSRFCENTFKFFNRIIRVRTRRKRRKHRSVEKEKPLLTMKV